MTRKKSNLLKIAIVGCGNISSVYFKTSLKMKDVEIVGTTDLQKKMIRDRVRSFSLNEKIIYNSMDEMLKQTKPDIVFDCTIPAAHCQVTTKALKAGCHVLGEKPMSDCMKNARKMVTAAKNARRTYAVSQNYRYNSNTRVFAKLIKNKIIGNLDMLNADYFMAPHFGGFREHIPHPILIEMATHTYDMARLISGADPVSVYCYEHNPKGSWYKGGNAAATSIFEMSNGIVFTYRGHWCAEGLNTSWNSQWRAVGDKGTAIYDGQNPPWVEIVVKKGKSGKKAVLKQTQMKSAVKLDNGHFSLIYDFINCIRNRRKPETDCTDNIKSIAMVFASMESAKTGKCIKIKL